MKELYNEFFRISKHEKISDKAMLARVVMTVSIVVLCLAGMSITAYAYFSCNVTSVTNMIQSADFEAVASITNQDPAGGPVVVSKSGKAQIADLDAGEYTVELSKGDSSAGKGFCIITIGDKKYYSDQIGIDSEKGLTDAKVKFDLILSSPARIEVISHWGTSVHYGYGGTGRTEIFVVDGNTVDLTPQTASDGGEAEKNTSASTETTQSAETEQTPDTSTAQATDGTTTPPTGATTPSTTTSPETTQSGETDEKTDATVQKDSSEKSDANQQTQTEEAADQDATKAEGAEDSGTASAEPADVSAGNGNEQ